MPHITFYAAEQAMADTAEALIGGLTDAVAEVYGVEFRSSVHVLLVGVPTGRWGVGGHVDANPPPVIHFGLRESAFARADADAIITRLFSALTRAVADALGEDQAGRTQIELHGLPAGRTALGGELVY